MVPLFKLNFIKSFMVSWLLKLRKKNLHNQLIKQDYYFIAFIILVLIIVITNIFFSNINSDTPSDLESGVESRPQSGEIDFNN
jgi:hypothetical protein